MGLFTRQGLNNLLNGRVGARADETGTAVEHRGERIAVGLVFSNSGVLPNQDLANSSARLDLRKA